MKFEHDNYHPRDESICHKDFDIGFIIDDSDSLKKAYRKEKQFIVRFAKHFDISGSRCRASLIQFSWKAKHSIKMKEYDNLEDFSNAVLAVRRMGSITRIDLALKKSRDEQFKVANGARSHMPKLLVLITDGMQTVSYGYTKPEIIAKEIRDTLGAHLLVIGVGKLVDDEQLKKIAGPGGKWEHVRDFNELRSQEFVKRISSELCEDPPPSNQCQPVKIPPPCQRNDFQCCMKLYASCMNPAS